MYVGIVYVGIAWTHNIVSFFFLFALTLSQWFLHKTAAFYTEQCTSPSLLHNFEVL